MRLIDSQCISKAITTNTINSPINRVTIDWRISFFFRSSTSFSLRTCEAKRSTGILAKRWQIGAADHWSRRALGNNRRLLTRLRPSNEDSISTRVGKIVDELVGELVNEWLANIARRVLLSAIIARESELASFLARRERAGSRSRADRIKKNTGRRQSTRRTAEWRSGADDNETVRRRSIASGKEVPAGAFVVFLLSLSLSLSLSLFLSLFSCGELVGQQSN